MCGILAVLGYHGTEPELRAKLLTAAKKIRHRGPDWSGIHIQVFPSLQNEGRLNGFVHERLSIMDPMGGAQPIFDPSGKAVLCVNGEIFNYKELREEFIPNDRMYCYSTKSDCEPILPGFLFNEPMEFVQKLKGQFAFVVSDAKSENVMIARDPIGVCPLYYGSDVTAGLWVSSEMKCLDGICFSYKCFPPGHLLFYGKYYSHNWEPIQYFRPEWLDEEYIPKSLPNNALEHFDYEKLRTAFETSVKRRMMCDVPYGVLLSGGLDSSLVASIVSRYAKEFNDSENSVGIHFSKVHSFSIGLPGSPDLKAAKEVAKFLGTVHHEITFTLQEGIDALRDVIYHLETYDVTTIRASTPMYLMSRKIKSMGIKMVLSGEGADEVFAGYLYFHKAPNKEELQAELVRKIARLHLYDCLRADKSSMAWGLEARVPFLDSDFLDYAMMIDPACKMIRSQDGIMEKYILRKAFDTKENPYLPDSVLWRQKEQFSDGVGYGWIDSLRDHANIVVSDLMFRNRMERYPVNTPSTKEAYLFRAIFEDLFKNPCAVCTVPGGPSIACSTPTAIKWDKEWEQRADPSGRAIHNIHNGTEL